MNTHGRGALCAATFSLFAIVIPSTARAETDSCTLLTPAQVGAAAGVAVGNGTHVTPTSVKTCTWTPSGKSSVGAVTLFLQTAAAYDGGKQNAVIMVAGVKGTVMKPASVGDDAYYYITGDQAMLWVRKGGVSFKVSVYARIPVADKEAIELKLAKEVVAKL